MNTSNPDPMATPSRPPRRKLPFAKWLPILPGMAVGLVMRLAFSGQPAHPYSPMMGTFILLTPLLVGAITVYVAERHERRTWSYYAWASFMATQLFVLGSMLIMIEGLICAILIAPLFGALGVMGGLIMGAVCRSGNWPKQTVCSLAALPLVFGGLEQHLPLPEHIRVVEHTRLIRATPDQVWQQLMNAKDIEPHEVEHAWMYRIGVPLPKAGMTQQTVQGLVRHVTMGRGIHFEQVSTQWQANHHVRWTYRFAEDSIPPQALDDHVKIGGLYFDLIDTEYSLTPQGSGTALRIAMHYRVSTQFNWYAQPIADFLIGNFERVILDFYARRAEAGPA